MRQLSWSRRSILVVLAGITALAGGCRGSEDGQATAPGAKAPPRQADNSAAQAAPGSLPLAERLKVPEGFRIEVVARGLSGVRLLAFSPDGRLFATQPGAGQVTVVPVGQGSPHPWATGLNRPHGIAFHDGYLYVAETNAVARWSYRPGLYEAPGRPEHIADLPGGGQHWTRTVHFGPDGRMYVSVGSSCNVCIEQNPRRATILQFDAGGGEGRIYAGGLRNTVDFDWDSQGRLWGVDNGTDRMGDDYPPEELNLIRDGGFYGWPYAHGDCRPDPRFGDRRPERVEQCIAPEFKMQAHTAPLGMAFYDAGQFPAAYRGDLFVALHGSWNRSTPVGYKVIRIHFEEGRPVRATDFVTGFGLGRSAWARPVAVLVGPEGSLFLTDDRAGHIWRVRYMGDNSSQRSTMR